MSARRLPDAARWASWVVLVVVVGAALGIGASRGGAPPSAAQRAQSVDAQVRCPSCEDISVADSSASTALAIRQLVVARVRAGQSDQQIDAFLVSRYGPGILLRPPDTGVTAWVWILPPVAVAAAVVGLAAALWRRRRMSVPAASVADRALVDRALAERAAAARVGTDDTPAPRRDTGAVVAP